MFPIVRLIGALCPREIPDGAGEAANSPNQGHILKIPIQMQILSSTLKASFPFEFR